MRRTLFLVVLLTLAITSGAQTASPSGASASAATIKPADNLTVEGVPSIPASIAGEVNRYTEFRTAGFRSWHPTKREMLIGTRFADVPQIHRVATPMGARTQLTFFPDRVGGGEYRPSTGEYFVFSKDEGGNEFFQYYRDDVATGDITLLTDGKSRNTGWVFSTAGDRAVFGSTKRNGDDVDIYIIDPKNPQSAKLLLENKGGGWSALDWSEDDKWVAVSEGISAAESYIWLVDTATGKKELLTPKGEEKVDYSGAEFGKDGKGVYTTTDKDSEFHRLAYIDIATKKHTYLSTAIKWDVQSFDLSKDGKTIAFVTNENGIGKLHLLDTATGKEKPAPKLPPGSVDSANWHDNNIDLEFNLDSAQSPSDVYSINTRTGKVDRWTQSETGGVVTTDLQEPELIKWKSFDGLEISGFLYKPPAAKFPGKRPVIVNIHGGPEGQSQPGFLGRNNYYLKELGVAIVFPNVRGSTGYGKTFLAMDNGFNREKSYKDIDTLLDYIKTRPDLDGEKIMVTGGSYGGFMTLQVATNYSDKICCALDVVGISNLVTFLQNTSGYRRDLRRVEYGDERDPKMREFMEKIAALNNADKIKKPLFVVQGKNDPRVPYTEAMQIVQKARNNGVPVWFLMAADEGHGFAKKKNQDFQFYATVMFIKEFLLK
jgi:dipeptidyl aminopeptidase/acylaminoacyl peptidase